jgi:hypothetical protein
VTDQKQFAKIMKAVDKIKPPKVFEEYVLADG